MWSPSTSALRRERITRHGLSTRPAPSPRAAVRMTTAIQAQDNFAARLGVRARALDITDVDVVQAIEEERSVVRTWLMRGTIHLVDAADVRWLVRLIGPAIARKYRTRWRQLGLTDDVLARALQLLPELLADGPRNRHEIRAGLAAHGLTIESPDPQIHTHALVYASTVGLICRGPDRGRHSTFVLLDKWLPGAPEGPFGDDALAELARRYFAAYSPATAADFAAWSGLPAKQAITLIRDELKPVECDGWTGFRLGECDPQEGVRLLPAFDNYLIGYRDRSAIIDADRVERVYQGGLIRPTVLLDGRVAGTWQLDRAKDQVRVQPFEPYSRAVRRDVEAELVDVGRFLDRELAVSFDADGAGR
jgi:hypothetical protein